jgi:hypothetical protein
MLVDMVASFMDLQPAERQEILETIDLEARFDRVLVLIAHRIDVMQGARADRSAPARIHVARTAQDHSGTARRGR